MILPELWPHSLLLRSLILKLADDHKIQLIFVAFSDVNSIKSAYSAGIKDRIYIRFAETHLCGQV